MKSYPIDIEQAKRESKESGTISMGSGTIIYKGEIVTEKELKEILKPIRTTCPICLKPLTGKECKNKKCETNI